MPHASAPSCSDARKPEVAKTDAAVARMSAFRSLSRPRSGIEVGPAPRALAGQQTPEAESREVRGRDRDVGAFELAGVRVAHAVGELLVMVDEQVEVVVHQLERAVDHVAEQ